MKKHFIFILSTILCGMTIFSLCGCSNQSESSGTVKIAAKDFTEQYILGEILKAVVEEYTDYDVELTSGIAGETSIIMPAMENGDFDLYSEYDSTAWMTVLKKTMTSDIDDMHRHLDEIYSEQYQMDWLGYYGLDNKYSLAVQKDTAKQYQLKTFSDLKKVADKMVLGAGYEFFEREDGYDGLVDLYGFEFKDTKEMNLGLKYTALLDGQVDVITIYQTDGQAANPNVVFLEDDLGYFPPALAGTLVRQESLEQFPQLEAALLVLNNQISTEEMQAMNAAVDLEGKDSKKVAVEFLEAKGLIK